MSSALCCLICLGLFQFQTIYWWFCSDIELLKYLHEARRLTHWGSVTHKCVSKLTYTGSDNGLTPGRRQAIIWTSAGILYIGPLGTNFSESSIRIQTFLLKKYVFENVVWKMAILSRPQCVKHLLKWSNNGLMVSSSNLEQLSKLIMIMNTLTPRQNGRHFTDDIIKCIFLNESVWISIKISLKCVPRGPIDNIPALVQIMAWRRLGDKSLSEPMMVRLPTHICVTRPQWVNHR